MTIEEKRKAIENWCNCFLENHNCLDCPIYQVIEMDEYCFSPGDEYDGEPNIERNYALVLEYECKNGAPAVDKLTRHEQICDEIKALYKRKNADYGDSFHNTFVEEGMAMPRIRLTDKLERFKKLTKSGEQNVNDESVRDTLIDLANYAIMTILELED